MSASVLLETDPFVLLEPGGTVLLEGSGTTPVDPIIAGMLQEGGFHLVLEDGSGGLLVEGSAIPTLGFNLLEESGFNFLLEDGSGVLMTENDSAIVIGVPLVSYVVARSVQAQTSMNAPSFGVNPQAVQ